VVYLDHAATTPLRPEAREALARASAAVGNPASIHADGRRARRLLEDAREQVAETLGCAPVEVVFTSGGTEAINLAIKGLFWARPGSRIVLPDGEHHATLDTAEWLERVAGAVLDTVPLDAEGRIRLDAARESLEHEPADIALATALWANNEVGTVQPVGALAALSAENGVPLHVDAVAAYGHVPIDVRALASGLAALSVSAHKIGGPVGIGALYLARDAVVEPLLHGGGQQRNVRSGTQDVAAAVAFAAAARAAMRDLEGDARRLAALRQRALDGIKALVPEAVVNGPARPEERLPGTLHVTFPGCSGEALLFVLDAAGVSVSTGSACQAGVPEPSHVLLAMGRDERDARSAIRVTLGHDTSETDVEALLAALPAAHAQAALAGHP